MQNAKRNCGSHTTSYPSTGFGTFDKLGCPTGIPMKLRSQHARPALALLLSLVAAVALPAQRPTDILVTTDWLAKHLRDPGLVILHASPQKTDYDAGHVPGARFLPWLSYTTQRDGLSTELPDMAQLDSVLENVGISDDSRIVITGGPLTTSARLYYTLDYFGLGNRVSLLDGGIDAWREEGRAVERAMPAPPPRGTLTLRTQTAKLADARWIVNNATPDKHIAVLDARLPEFFAGLAANNTPRAGRLPTAQNVPFTWLTGEMTRFRDRGKLERLFTQAGVKPGDTVVTYCHIGMQGSVLYMAARLLGHDAALYDGSFEDWSRRSELPVGGPPQPTKPPQS
jgi:thiosulfate/3-mercaptopyruvate sulfurtransferase